MARFTAMLFDIFTTWFNDIFCT